MSELRDNMEKLYQLQLVDSEIIENLRELKRLQSADSDIAKRYQEYTEQKAAVDAEINPIKNEAKALKDENAKHIEKKKNCEDRLFNGDTDPRDLQFLQKEREQIMNLIKKNEDDLVRLMVKVDSAEIKKSEYDEKLAELEPQFKREEEEKKESITKRTARLEVLKAERKELLNFDDKSVLSLYQKLQRENDGVAIVTISEGVCDGCFVEVPKSTMQQIADSEDIVKCQRCGRILYYPEAEAQAAEPAEA